MAKPATWGAAAPLVEGPPRVLRVGTWNLTGWTAERATAIATSVPVDLLAIQETHLAKLAVEKAHTTARNAGLRLHHGRPAQRYGSEDRARACGVGFIVREGIAIQPALPTCPAWCRLHDMRRLHGIALAPRPDLPHGLLFLSVYAPLPGTIDRPPFDLAMEELSYALDMQLPTLIMGDFNGSVDPARDYRSQSGARRPVCPLLAKLLGPGSPWMDVQELMLPPPLPWTYQQPNTSAASRIDLVLANASALRLIHSALVLEEVRDGGHSPVLIHLALDTGHVDWQPPRPRPPPLLYEPSAALAESSDWAHLIDQWLQSPEVASLAPQPGECVDTVGSALRSALHRLVSLAGGWSSRPKQRRLAYDSNAIRHHRRLLADLLRVEAESNRPTAQPGPWPHHLQQRLEPSTVMGCSCHATAP